MGALVLPPLTPAQCRHVARDYLRFAHQSLFGGWEGWTKQQRISGAREDLRIARRFRILADKRGGPRLP